MARHTKELISNDIPPDLTSISVRSTATSSGTTIVAPSDIQPGDVLVLQDFSFNSTATVPTSVTPTNFDTPHVDHTVGSYSRHMVSTKLANGSEAGATITGMAGTFGVWKHLVVLKGNAPATSKTVSTPNAQVTTGNPTAQNVAASGGVAPLVVFGFYACDNNVNPRTMSPAKDAELNFDTEAFVAWKIQNSSPVDVSVDMDDEGGANYLASLYIAMAN